MQRAALEGILAEVGFAGALLVRELEPGVYQTLDGHLRAETTPDMEVPVLVLDVTEEEADKLLAVYDPLSALAMPDPAKLAALLSSLRFDSAVLAGLHGPVVPPVAVDIDDIAEPPGEAVTQPGDLWILGDHRLLCGDSTDAAQVAAALAGARPVLTFVDPPFDVDYSQWSIPDGVEVLYVWGRGDRHLRWMCALPEPWKITCTFVFTGQARGWARPEMPCLVHETVYVVRGEAKAAPDWTVARDAGLRLTVDGRPFSHLEKLASRSNEMSWSKSVGSMEVGICYTARGETVWDPCAGSGSSLLAAHRHGRIWRGMESQPRWCDLIASRFDALGGAKSERIASRVVARV